MRSFECVHACAIWHSIHLLSVSKACIMASSRAPKRAKALGASLAPLEASEVPVLSFKVMYGWYELCTRGASGVFERRSLAICDATHADGFAAASKAQDDESRASADGLGVRVGEPLTVPPGVSLAEALAAAGVGPCERVDVYLDPAHLNAMPSQAKIEELDCDESTTGLGAAKKYKGLSTVPASDQRTLYDCWYAYRDDNGDLGEPYFVFYRAVSSDAVSKARLAVCAAGSRNKGPSFDLGPGVALADASALDRMFWAHGTTRAAAERTAVVFV